MKSQSVSAIFGERRFTQELRKLGVKVEVSTKGTNRDKCVVYGYRFQNGPSERRMASEEAFYGGWRVVKAEDAEDRAEDKTVYPPLRKYMSDDNVKKRRMRKIDR